MSKTYNVLRKNVLFIGKAFDAKWELEDPTGKSDDEFKKVIKMIEERVLKLREDYLSDNCNITQRVV